MPAGQVAPDAAARTARSKARSALSSEQCLLLHPNTMPITQALAEPQGRVGLGVFGTLDFGCISNYIIRDQV